MSVKALSSLPAPSGGAVLLHVHTDAPDTYVLILASPHPTAPDPDQEEDARKVHGGKLTFPVRPRFQVAQHAYQVLDLKASELPDGQTVYYHVYEVHPDGTRAAPLTVHCTPRCTRESAVTIARDVVRERLEYHIRRALDDGKFGPNVEAIPVLEQEVRAEGQGLPAIYLKERVAPNPSADSVGNNAGQFVDAHHPQGVKEYRFEYRASVDLLILSLNPSERTELEAYVRGCLDADKALFQSAGLEAPSLSAFTRHDADDQSDLYGAEVSLECGITTRVAEFVTGEVVTVER